MPRLTAQQRDELIAIGATHGGPAPFSGATARADHHKAMDLLEGLAAAVHAGSMKRGYTSAQESDVMKRAITRLHDPSAPTITSFDELFDRVPFSASDADFRRWDDEQVNAAPHRLPQPDPRDQQRGRDYAQTQYVDGKLRTGLPKPNTPALARQVGLTTREMQGRSASPDGFDLDGDSDFPELTEASRKWMKQADTTTRSILARTTRANPGLAQMVRKREAQQAGYADHHDKWRYR